MNCRNEALFFGLDHARQAIAARWAEDLQHRAQKPHFGARLSDRTPADFAAKLIATGRHPRYTLRWRPRARPVAQLRPERHNHARLQSTDGGNFSGRSPASRASQLLPRRWVVERSFAWLSRCRRLARTSRPLSKAQLPGYSSPRSRLLSDASLDYNLTTIFMSSDSQDRRPPPKQRSGKARPVGVKTFSSSPRPPLTHRLTAPGTAPPAPARTASRFPP